MKLVISNRTIGILLVVLFILVVLIIFLVYRSRSKYVWPEASTPAGSAASAYTTYQSAVTACNSTYAAAVIAGTSTAATDKTTCLENATRTYLKARCPIVDTSLTSATLSTALGNLGLSSIYTSAKSAFDTDITNIRSAFLTVFTTPPTWPVPLTTSVVNVDPSDYPSGGSPTTAADLSTYLIKKARDAAIAGATRKFIAAVCGEYYKTTDNGNSTDAFKAWTYPTVSTSASGLTNQVTVADVLLWVKRAGWNGPLTSGAAATDNPYYKWETSGGTPTNTLFNVTGARDINYGKVKDSSTGAVLATQPTYKVWEVARYNGPGSGGDGTNAAARAQYPTSSSNATLIN